MRKCKQIDQRYWSFSSGKIGDLLFIGMQEHLVIKDYREMTLLNKNEPHPYYRKGPISFRVLFNEDLGHER